MSKTTAALVFSCVLFGTVVSSVTFAQDPASGLDTPANPMSWNQAGQQPVLLTPDDGLNILGAALEQRHRSLRGLDCSHLVHAIYERAGFPYPYSSSAELYAGIEQFQRVTAPQPGDLIVWRGHVGIVINPQKQSFFSAMRSGRGVEKYDSHYWRARGHYRCFRYIKATPEAASYPTANPGSFTSAPCRQFACN